MSDFRCINELFNGSDKCLSKCDICRGLSGNLPPLNEAVLLLVESGEVAVGKWDGKAWIVHANGLRHKVTAWKRLPPKEDFISVE